MASYCIFFGLTLNSMHFGRKMFTKYHLPSDSMFFFLHHVIMSKKVYKSLVLIAMVNATKAGIPALLLRSHPNASSLVNQDTESESVKCRILLLSLKVQGMRSANVGLPGTNSTTRGICSQSGFLSEKIYIFTVTFTLFPYPNLS